MGNLLDIAILITTLTAGYLGWRVGGIRTLATVFGAASGGFVASQYYQHVATRLSWLVSSREAGELISFATIALGVFITAVLLGLIAQRLVRFLLLGWLDGALGCVAGMGLALGLAFFGVATLSSLPGADANELLSQSYAAQFVVDNASPVANLLPEPMSSYLDSNLMRPELSTAIKMALY